MPASRSKDVLVAAALASAGDTEQARRALSLEGGAPVAADAKEIALLESQLAAFAGAGDAQSAFLMAERLLDVDPSVARADQAVLLGLQAGQPEMSDRARAVLAEGAPDRLAALDLLFEPLPVPDEADQAGTIAPALQALDAEMSLIGGYLEDG